VGPLRSCNLGLVIRVMAIAGVVFAACLSTAGGATAVDLGTFAWSSRIGWKVNKTTGANVCSIVSQDHCQSGKISGGPGGFRYPASVAADPSSGELYVADTANSRVQKLTAAGAFVAMFGWGVNKTKNGLASATQQERNVCTAVSGDRCTAGIQGSAAEQLSGPGDVAVDPVTGDVYVLEISPDDYRLDKYSAAGRFLWMVGKQVNGATNGNICRASEIEVSHVRCRSGSEESPARAGPGAFKAAQTFGNLLAVGGPEDLVYVGDEHRVQELGPDGKARRELLLTSISAERYSTVVALALDVSGNLYVVYRTAAAGGGLPDEQSNLIRKFDAVGEQVAEFPVEPRWPGATVSIDGLATDPSGRLAVIGVEAGSGPLKRFGSLYDSSTGARLAGFGVPGDYDGLAFDRWGGMYIAATDGQEVAAYLPAPATESLISSGAGGGFQFEWWALERSRVPGQPAVGANT
jgi:tripartite motif-containing protein 71